MIGAAAAVLLAPAFMWAGETVVRRWGPEMYDNRLLRAIVPVNRGEWVGVVLALLPAAMLEELLFRSLASGRPDLDRFAVGADVAVQPALWTDARLSRPWGLVGTALMGLLLSGLFLYTGSIWAPIVAHWLLNVTEVTLAQRQGLRPLRADAHL